MTARPFKCDRHKTDLKITATYISLPDKFLYSFGNTLAKKVNDCYIAMMKEVDQKYVESLSNEQLLKMCQTLNIEKCRRGLIIND